MDKTVIKAWTALANITAPGATLPIVSEDAVMLEALLCDDEVAEIVRSDRDAIQLVRRGLHIRPEDAYAHYLLGLAAEKLVVKLTKAPAQMVSKLTAREIEASREMLLTRSEKRRPEPCDPPIE